MVPYCLVGWVNDAGCATMPIAIAALSSSPAVTKANPDLIYRILRVATSNHHVFLTAEKSVQAVGRAPSASAIKNWPLASWSGPAISVS